MMFFQILTLSKTSVFSKWIFILMCSIIIWRSEEQKNNWNNKNEIWDLNRRLSSNIEFLLRHNMQGTLIYLLRKIISSHLVFCRCASANDKFVTRLSFAIRIVWFTKLDDNNTAFISLWNSSSYIRRDSSKKTWTKSETIDRDVWRLRFANV